jgi:hypothetical protein
VRIPLALRYIDLVVLALALPLFVVAGLPMLGYLVGGAAWVIQRAAQVALTKRAAAADDPRALVGITAASMIGRGWFCALAIFAVGFHNDGAGLAAAVLVLSLFTIYFTAQMILRPMEKPLSKEIAR